MKDFEFLTSISENHGIPIRRASELIMNCPNGADAAMATKLMIKNINSVMSNFSSSLKSQVAVTDPIECIEKYTEEIQVYNSVDVFNCIWNGIPRFSSPQETSKIDLRSFISVSLRDDGRHVCRGHTCLQGTGHG
jgi:hypothetical protein